MWRRRYRWAQLLPLLRSAGGAQLLLCCRQLTKLLPVLAGRRGAVFAVQEISQVAFRGLSSLLHI